MFVADMADIAKLVYTKSLSGNGICFQMMKKLHTLQ